MKEIGVLSAADTAKRYSIPERIASHAAADPYRIAVADVNRRLTRRDLEHDSNRLAALLQKAGAKPERCVGIFLERSTEFVVAALAILKSGAAYLPLDPSTPLKRALSIFTDAGAVAVITASPLAEELAGAPCPLIAIEQVHGIAEKPFVQSPIDYDSLAYIIYTSGSTGQPKGVKITHANLCNLLTWHESAFSVTPADRASQLASLGFDAAVWEIWPNLAAGATLHIADESTRRSSESLQAWLIDEQITIAFVATALAEQLFSANWPRETALRLLLTGGDTLQRRPPPGLPFTVVNNYGPSECTVVSTSGIVAPEGNEVRRPSVGLPITNATAFILDASLRPVAKGDPGELCIGGAVVGRGYCNMPELTAKQFITYIAASGESVRLYRTGDRVRLLDNGEIEFLGRFDDQVKLRGHRIELGEIEACLNRSSNVLAAAVAIKDVAPGGRALVAYVVAAPGARLTEKQLREDLADQLPDYMIPAFFVSLAALPLMRNGKVDKTALPAPCAENLLLDASATNGGLSGLEHEIGQLVASLMSRPSIGANENFFMIGGHSMFGAQLVARIREVFGVQLPLRRIFIAPTVRELANEVAGLISAR